MTLAQEDIETGRRFIRQAEEELAQGDPLQASENAWMAVVHHLKGIARQRGWEHDGQRQLGVIADRLTEETGRREVRRLVSVADSLHVNFYNDWKPEEMVRYNVEDVKKLLILLGDLYENGGHAQGVGEPPTEPIQ